MQRREKQASIVVKRNCDTGERYVKSKKENEEEEKTKERIKEGK